MNLRRAGELRDDLRVVELAPGDSVRRGRDVGSGHVANPCRRYVLLQSSAPKLYTGVVDVQLNLSREMEIGTSAGTDETRTVSGRWLVRKVRIKGKRERGDNIHPPSERSVYIYTIYSSRRRVTWTRTAADDLDDLQRDHARRLAGRVEAPLDLVSWPSGP